ncbi:hypothetical protein [Plantactinospora sp. WMMB782]|uniref:hypothetical protein n=1 Tax=Plantactinospora sp. WMMB782 TaxID=3404121 RepID=UPI003B94AB15
MLLGSGEKREIDRAVTLLTSAAQDGDGFAAYNLGVLFRKGELVEADEARARAMFQLAGGLGLGAGAAVFAGYLAADGSHEQGPRLESPGRGGGFGSGHACSSFIISRRHWWTGGSGAGGSLVSPHAGQR